MDSDEARVRAESLRPALVALGWLPPERVAELRALAEVDQRGDFGAETVQTYIEAILDDTPRGPRERESPAGV